MGSCRPGGEKAMEGRGGRLCRWPLALGAGAFSLGLLAVLLVPSGPSGLASETAQATPQVQPTVQRGAGRLTRSPTIPGDINNDGVVDIRDYGIWRQNFGQTNCGNPADLNGDCLADIRDYAIW